MTLTKEAAQPCTDPRGHLTKGPGKRCYFCGIIPAPPSPVPTPKYDYWKHEMVKVGAWDHALVGVPAEGVQKLVEELGALERALAQREWVKPEFERIIQIQPPFDRRAVDPNKNYGIHGMTLRFILKGPKGATQFIYYTAQHLPHVADELYTKNRHLNYNPFHGMGADIGFHAYKPQYEGQKPMDGTCDILGCQCYYDGSSLQASEFEAEFLARGTDAVWPMLEGRYHTWFDEPAEPPAPTQRGNS